MSNTDLHTYTHTLTLNNNKRAFGLDRLTAAVAMFNQLVKKRNDKNCGVMWITPESERSFSEGGLLPEALHGAFRAQANQHHFFPAASMSDWPKIGREIGLGYGVWDYSDPSGVQEKKDQCQNEIRGLLETSAETVAPQAVEYACQLVDQFPSHCFLLPRPDISATAKGEVYFEWMLETDGKLLLTVASDGTTAYVCTFGTARSRNLGAWNDRIVDLLPPCFTRLVKIQQKGLHEWDAFKIAHLSPDSSLKETR